MPDQRISSGERLFSEGETRLFQSQLPVNKKFIQHNCHKFYKSVHFFLQGCKNFTQSIQLDVPSLLL
jgi:hypothetical protein